jgi:hypothetical protein
MWCLSHFDTAAVLEAELKPVLHRLEHQCACRAGQG